MAPAIALAGWLSAVVAALFCVVARRSRSSTMEAVARVCHELRGPITAARLGLALELGARTSELSPARLRAIDFELSTAALALDDLVDVGVRRPRFVTCEHVDIGALLADSVEALRPTAGDRGIALALARPGAAAMSVTGQRLRLAQATRNLIANAIEHGGGPVEVRGRVDAGRVRIEVTDGGPGLPAPVDQLTRRARAGRGTRGRGLAIAAAVAEEHGGRLAAAPSETGARLILELPAAAMEGG